MLIEQNIVVAENFKVNPLFVGTIVAGQAVALSSSDTVTDSDDYIAVATNSNVAIGIAGDHLGSSGPTNAYSEALLIGANGQTEYSQNRVSDFYNETLASGKMTVYMSGGTFFTDQFEADVVSAALGVALYTSANGKMTTVVGANTRRTATLVGSPTPFASGVPGTVVNGSQSLGNLIKFILNI